MATKKATTKKTSTKAAAAPARKSRAAASPGSSKSTRSPAKASAGKASASRAPARKAPARKAAAKAPTAKAPARKAVAAKAASKSAGRAPAKAAKAKAPAAKAAGRSAAPVKAPAKRRTIRRNGITVPPLIAGTAEPYPFDFDFLARQRQALLDERKRYVGHAERFEAEADALARDREPGDVQFDDESGEGDSIAVERERDLALSAQARQAVEEIDAALKRMQDGTYGLSVVSGLPIPRERLEAIPEASLRVEEKSAGPWR
jgi:RNA polymerase-binding transcription factor DksA